MKHRIRSRFPQCTRSTLSDAWISLISLSLVASTGWLLSCKGVEDPTDSPACRLQVLQTLDGEYAPGATEVLSVQALDANGNPTDGASVYFLNADPTLLAFDDGAGELVIEKTKTASTEGVSVAGLATQKLTVKSDAASGEAQVIVGLTSTCASGDGDTVKTVRLNIVSGSEGGEN